MEMDTATFADASVRDKNGKVKKNLAWYSMCFHMILAKSMNDQEAFDAAIAKYHRKAGVK